MALRPLMSLSEAKTARSGFGRLETEILAEAASSLGHQGWRAEAALQRLEQAKPEEREALTQAAAEAVWSYFVQREFCGMRDHGPIIREMKIPLAVLNRLGASARK